MLEIQRGGRVGPYKVIKPLEEEVRGAMATLFLAQLVRLEGTQLVVLKVVSAEEESAQERLNALRKEVEILQKLRHPNIVKIYPIPPRNRRRREGYISRATNVPGNPWFCALEYLKGGDLRSRLHELGSLPLEEAVEIAYQIGSALDYMHSKGYVHWDVKPENISFRYDLSENGKIEAVLTDFGIARGTHEPAEVTGTVDYMSPERLKVHMGEIPPDQITDQRPADVYALGVVLYEMLAGSRPFVAEDEEALKYAILEEPPIPLTDFKPEVPAVIEDVIFQALEKDPANRLTMEEMMTMLDRAVPPIRIGAGRPPEEEEKEVEEEKPKEVAGPRPSPILHFLQWSFAIALVVALAMALFVGGVGAARFAGFIPPLTPPPTPVTVTPATPTPIPPTPTPIPTPPPIVSSIIPKSASTDEGSVTVTIEGENFRDTPEVFLTNDVYIPATEVSVSAGSRIRCSFSIADAKPGVWGLLVSNPDGTSDELADAFTITRPPSPPIVSSIIPNSASTDEGSVTVTIEGENFRDTPKVFLTNHIYIPATEVSVSAGSRIRCSFSIADAKPGVWGLLVSNPDRTSDELADAFTITAPPPISPAPPPSAPPPSPPPPEITGLDPNNSEHDRLVEVTITGKNLSQSTRVLLIGPAHQVPASSIQVIDDSQIRCRFDLPTVPWTQKWTLRVEGPGGSAEDTFYVKGGGGVPPPPPPPPPPAP